MVTNENNGNDSIDQNNFSFGIQDTLEMGMGSRDLLDDLISPETSTADPNKLKDITDEEEEEIKTPVPNKKAQQPAKTPEKPEEVEEENPLDSFLENEEEEEEDIVSSKTAKKPLGAEAEEEEDDNPKPKGTTPFQAISDELFNLGIFNRGEDEEGEDPIIIDSPEAFSERFTLEKKKGAIEMVDNFIGQFGPEYQDAFDAIFVKGLDPREYYTSVNQISDFSELDMQVESNQERVVRQALTDQGFDKEDVESEISRLKDYGDLADVSLKHHKVLVKKEAASLHEKTKNAQLAHRLKQESKQIYHNNVNKVLGEKIKEKAFDGIPLNPKIATELQDFLLVDKWKTDSGETLTDFDRYILELKKPENHATKVKVGLLLKLLEKDPTLSTIQKSGVTKKTDTLFKEISKQVANTSDNTKNNQKGVPARSWFQS